MSNLPMPLGPALKADLPDVKRFARLQDAGENLLVRTPNGVIEKQASFVDPALFELFSFPFLYGNTLSALAAPNHVVLTKKMAQKLQFDFVTTQRIIQKIGQIRTKSS